MSEQAAAILCAAITPGETALKGEAPASRDADDQNLFVPLGATVAFKPLWISPRQNRWCEIVTARKPGVFMRRSHTREVLAYTISGKWGYRERAWTGIAGDFTDETPGEIHTLLAYEAAEPLRVLFVVGGPVALFDDADARAGFCDVHSYIDLCRDHYSQTGLGAGYVETLLR